MEFDWKSPNYALVYEQRAERLSNIRATPEILAGLKESIQGYKHCVDGFVHNRTFNDEVLEYLLSAIED